MPGTEVPPESHRPGDTVHVVSIGKQGIVVDVDGAAAVVAFGSVKMRVAFGDLRRVKRGVLEDAPVKAAKGKKGGARAKLLAADAKPATWRTKDASNTIDLRGTRVDEALDVLDKGLDTLFQSEAGVAYVIHGFCTGAVRAAVRDHLPKHPLVSEWRPCTPDEGGDGATLVVLR